MYMYQKKKYNFLLCYFFQNLFKGTHIRKHLIELRFICFIMQFHKAQKFANAFVHKITFDVELGAKIMFPITKMLNILIFKFFCFLISFGRWKIRPNHKPPRTSKKQQNEIKIMKSNPHLFEDCGFRHFQFVRSLNHPQMDHSMKHCQNCTRNICCCLNFLPFFAK